MLEPFIIATSIIISLAAWRAVREFCLWYHEIRRVNAVRAELAKQLDEADGLRKYQDALAEVAKREMIATRHVIGIEHETFASQALELRRKELERKFTSGTTA